MRMLTTWAQARKSCHVRRRCAMTDECLLALLIGAAVGVLLVP